MISRIFLTVFGITFFILVFGIVGKMDYQDHLLQQAHYCEMRELYDQDKNDNVPASERRGWPNFKDREYKCDE